MVNQEQIRLYRHETNSLVWMYVLFLATKRTISRKRKTVDLCNILLSFQLIIVLDCQLSDYKNGHGPVLEFSLIVTV